MAFRFNHRNLLLVLLFGAINISFSQSTLKGEVIDEEIGEGLLGVSIYLPELELGSVSDTNGHFEIDNIPYGNYKIIASYIGFSTYSNSITIKEGENNLIIYLTASAIEMEEVIVSTPFHKLQRDNVMKVEQAKVSSLRELGAITLAEGITNIPGVESVSTGMGIGKPVIRGLSSNRVVVYTQGIRLENQQYGDEHGLGVNDAGIESVEVIKGPASLLYGSDALGGVLYLNPEKFALANTTQGDINLNYFTNTLGIQANAGIKTTGEKFKFLFRGAINSNADYKGGNNIRVTNSRFKEYDIKSGLGYQFEKFKTEIRYNYNYSTLGIPEEITIQNKERTPLNPYQEIGSNIISSKSNYFFDNSSISLTMGYINNNRKEFEDEEDIDVLEEEAALDMVLSTFNYNLQYNLPTFRRWEIIAGVQGMNQSNKNFGEEVLIPNAITNDFGVLSTSHLHFEKSDIQIGLRYDYRGIDSEENGIVGGDEYIQALNRNFNSINAAFGYRLNLVPNLIGRINLASGFRAPNLSELTSNGIHEGTNRYEIGDPNLDSEKNIQTDIALEYQGQHFEFFANGFYNSVYDFIYVEPNGDFIEGNPVYLYKQQNAVLYGGELGYHFHPHPLDWLHIQGSFESVTGTLENDESLPLIPANKLSNTVRFEFNRVSKWLSQSFIFFTLNNIFDQNKVSDFETPTDSYNLFNMGLGGTIVLGNQPLEVRITAVNLFNENYISHLSRLKIDGISNIGRNVSIGLRLPL